MGLVCALAQTRWGRRFFSGAAPRCTTEQRAEIACRPFTNKISPDAPPPPNTAQPHETPSTRRPQKNTMSIRVGINGFGRIGRLVMRAAQTNPNISIVGVSVESKFWAPHAIDAML